jgi:uncharacterized protein with FMN-binding domain
MVRGKIVEQSKESVTISVAAGNRQVTRKFPRASVKSITIDGRRQPARNALPSKTTGDEQLKRSREEISALVEQAGRMPPDWFHETKLNYPPGLDLAWPHPPQGPWNNQKNLGQFIWDIVNPNPGRWREGVRLMHQVLVKNQQDPVVRERAMLELARMYHDLLEDYARSAFWYRAVGAEKNPQEYSQSAVMLAECYWRLGSRETAVELLEKTPPSFTAVKLWADLGETDKSITMAKEYGGEDAPDLAFLLAGDACRVAGRYDEALDYYQKALDVPVDNSRPARVERNRSRAKASMEAIRLFDALDLAKIPDGNYRARSMGYEGNIEVEVAVKQGRIADVEITQHREKQFYSAMTDTPQKIIAKQGVRGVDATSAATITSEAIINATAKALAGAQKK